MIRLTSLLITLLISFSVLADVPEEAFSFDFNVRMIRMERVKEEKVFEAIELLRKVFASREFKRRILRHRYNNRRTFAHNRGKSNKQIYQEILEGVERLIPDRNNAMDVELELYTDYDSNVLGFTRPSTKRIWMNTKYFNRYGPAQIAANLTHEWLHKLGFDHDHSRTKRRKFSVPYAIGYIVRDLAERAWELE